MSYLTVPLTATHKKAAFECSQPMLTEYLHIQAKQNVKKQVSACFILEGEDSSVSGYYTLASASIERKTLPVEIIKKLPPSYHNLPATLLGRLAVDNSCVGQGMGKLLLLDALKRSFDATATVASMAVIVDPIDVAAVNFYLKFGFILLPDSGKMFLPMATIAQLF